MTQNLERTIASISKRVTLLFLSFFILLTIIGIGIIFLQLEWSWLKLFSKTLLKILVVLFTTRLIIPGFFLFFGYPEFAYAWYQGTGWGWPQKTWEQLSKEERSFIYVNLIAPWIIMLIIIVIVVFQWAEKVSLGNAL